MGLEYSYLSSTVVIKVNNVKSLWFLINEEIILFSSVQSLSCVGPHGLQHARPGPPPTPGDYSNSCPLIRWCHPTISSCHPLLLSPSIFPSIRDFQMSQLFASGGQSIGVSVSASVLSMNIQD